jgi:hypothetical protein
MVTRRTVDLRANSPLQFGDDHTRHRYERTCATAKEQQRLRGQRFAVAPQQQLALPSGRTLVAGDAVSPADLLVRGGSIGTAEHELVSLVTTGVVLEADLPDGPAAA